MKRIILAALTGLALSAPVHAQMTESSCAVSWGMISTPLGLPPNLAAAQLENGACVARDLEIVTGRLRILVDDLRWQVEGLEALLVSGALLNRVELSAGGVYVLAATGMPDFDYVMEAQARAGEGISVDLLATHADGEVMLDRLHVDFPGENAIDATLQLTDVDPRAPDQAVIRAARLEVLTRGLFETYALMPLANLLLGSSDEPEAEVARLQAETIAAIETLPEPLFDRSTRAALVMLVQDMPNPAGRVIFELQAENGLPVVQLTEDAGMLGRLPASDPLSALAGAELRVSYYIYGEE
ncbi:hypothetical protein [Nioella aestuarii]|uniref:hypothetical protein n=1 Tax=Nioella aestuarii TaxID=1662864 RepID=UPI003D7FE191